MKTITEVFEQVCPTYMAYGMSWEQFWYGDPWMAKDYYDAYILKRRMQNENLWLAGLYNFNAFQAVLATAFGKKREKYIEEPLSLFPKTEAEVIQEKVRERQKIITWLNRWKNSRTQKQEGEKSNGKP